MLVAIQKLNGTCTDCILDGVQALPRSCAVTADDLGQFYDCQALLQGADGFDIYEFCLFRE